ncbi:unnamed protein product [Tuber melanosporum]|uniref:(Perigord truffle) hypothetical protein n=1 Tax=Tuber melanosporum (strain Mel28) TaxID=656061 RepID=D5GCJ0_TUBMM|nr:uncharacterized protein GSTUM_00005909001 [Tuber melanosporum]CAZ82233.1 unnamed protein product [Tuber melanosporum]
MLELWKGISSERKTPGSFFFFLTVVLDECGLGGRTVQYCQCCTSTLLYEHLYTTRKRFQLKWVVRPCRYPATGEPGFGRVVRVRV